MSENPLMELAAERQVRLASEFQKAAAELTGEKLAAAFQGAVASAPRRAEAGKAFFDPHPARRRTKAKERDAEDLAAALVGHCRGTGKGLWMPKILPDEPDHTLEFLDHRVPMKGKREDKGTSHLDLVGLLDDRLAAVKFKYVAPTATRGSTGDTPLRFLLEGLSDAAAAAASAEAMREELAKRFEREVADAPPALILIATRRYWELARKRSVQKGAHWINQLERLSGEVEEAAGIAVEFLGVELNTPASEPAWEIEKDEKGEEVPVLREAPRLTLAWEATAGRVKPKSKPKPKNDNTVEIVEADPSRPPRPYRITESYEPGDTIQHKTLGNGVVQCPGGPGKIQVIFDGVRKVLVHERPAS
ncbi:MAG: hypothetical protein HKP30_03600 [Myxococcales bacterium]|nr:hypothetical protein [Myxococcales bacterium]